MPISPDAILSVASVAVLTIGGALWRQSTMLAEVRGQVRHNGGSTLKDDARKAAQAAERAEVVADEARVQATALRVVIDRLEQRSEADRERRLAEGGRRDEQDRKLQHDLTNVRSSIAVLAHVTERINADRIVREEAWIAALRAQGLATPDAAPIVPTSKP